MFNKILIANRGEIACRVISTARRLGINTVAVYSEADAAARHVALADEAFAIGPAPARDSYLVAEKSIEAAKHAGAEAIHPGYGFLSENSGFAGACADNGIVFIGPPVRAIEIMGSKSAAKQMMQDAGVPLVPGYHGDNQDELFLFNEAEKIGFPIMIKASAGGGGKGMRVVKSAISFIDALRSARREALASFNDDKVLLEKYLDKPRHIELQIFCDNHGNAVHLFERDCSIQRRHQKVLEEAPAPGLTLEKRTAMGNAALTAARAINYAGAGTVEFIVDEDGTFYFMEMNTRLQVEHPVTELITGQDLVEWQLLVAAGAQLPVTQEQLTINGHALEARIYAEDPDNHFLPSIGQLNHLRFPAESNHIRVDTGVRQGDFISVHYDPMIAKLITWGSDRKNCLRRMHEALSQTQIAGVTTNINFLASVVSHEAFQAAELDTGFIERHQAALLPDTGAIDTDIPVLAALYQVLQRERLANEHATSSPDPTSPWRATDNWRLNLVEEECFRFHERAGEHEVRIAASGARYITGPRPAVESNKPEYSGDEYVIRIGDQITRVSGNLDRDGRLTAILDNTQRHITVVEDHAQLVLFYAGRTHRLERVSDTFHSSEEETTGNLISPMPGRIIEVITVEGQQVKKGDALLVLEAMKMEHIITAPHDGVVQTLHYHTDDMVDEGVELLLLTDK